MPVGALKQIAIEITDKLRNSTSLDRQEEAIRLVLGDNLSHGQYHPVTINFLLLSRADRRLMRGCIRDDDS